MAQYGVLIKPDSGQIEYKPIPESGDNHLIYLNESNIMYHNDALYNWYAVTHFYVKGITNGYLYNWYAATDARNIAPEGWHVPTENDLETLLLTIDPLATNPYSNSAGGHLKESGFSNWFSPNTDADNSSGFTALGSGARDPVTGIYTALHSNFVMWGQENIDANHAASAIVTYNEGYFVAHMGFSHPQSLKAQGNSIRLIKDDSSDPGTMTGNDGKKYTTITIGTQVWLVENIAETKYRNGNLITKVIDNATWTGLTTEAYCAYDNDESYTFQYIYNIAPTGWHVPTIYELINLKEYLDPTNVNDPNVNIAGGPLKSTGFDYWNPPNTDATNTTGFSALGSGFREETTGTFSSIREMFELSSTSSFHPDQVSIGSLQLDDGVFHCGTNTIQGFTAGLSVRFIKNDSTPTDCIDYSGNNYGHVVIGSQVWSRINFYGRYYNDGTPIPNVINDATWGGLTTGAMCYYPNV